VLLGPTARALDRALTPQACAGDSLLSRIRVVLDRWEHRADTTSVAHAYLRYARIALNEFAIDSLLAPCRARDSSFTFDWALEDEVTRRLLEARPMNLLPASFAEWDDLVRAAAKAATVRIETRAGGEPFDRVTWGRINRSRINHPLGDAVPTLDRWLDMPHAALRGGSGLIRVANARSGASLRMVVDLADSSRSLFSMPGGQSGHFLSPHFADHFAGWVEGRAGAFLPGPPRRTVRLHPAPSR
jgi:penicillin amidase